MLVQNGPKKVWQSSARFLLYGAAIWEDNLARLKSDQNALHSGGGKPEPTHGGLLHPVDWVLHYYPHLQMCNYVIFIGRGANSAYADILSAIYSLLRRKIGIILLGVCHPLSWGAVGMPFGTVFAEMRLLL